MRRFYVKAYDDLGNVIMTSIQVNVPEIIPLTVADAQMNDGRRADFDAINYVVGRVAGEFASYAASECLLAYDAPAAARKDETR